jgi:quinoprotein dehydrogenase-associated probable ABC transporter substrate-binding protein
LDVTMIRIYGQFVLIALAMLSASAAPLSPARAATAEAVDHTALRVCADPNNLPFSNDKGEGFENKIAEVLAAELGVPVRYTWFPDSVGFVRNTLRARACDLIVGTTVGAEMLQNTNPYYRSSFSLVYRKEGGLTLASLDDPALRTLQIGVIAGTPPTTLMAQRGLLGNSHSYQLLVDTRFDHPAQDMVHDVATGKIDVGILWGPIAGYFAKRETTPLVVVPLRSEGSPMHLDYRITMGVRPNEPEWKRQVNDLIRKKQPEITRILLDYGVPLLDEQGNPITN